METAEVRLPKKYEVPTTWHVYVKLPVLLRKGPAPSPTTSAFQGGGWKVHVLSLSFTKMISLGHVGEPFFLGN